MIGHCISFLYVPIIDIYGAYPSDLWGVLAPNEDPFFLLVCSSKRVVSNYMCKVQSVDGRVALRHFLIS